MMVNWGIKLDKVMIVNDLLVIKTELIDIMKYNAFVNNT